MTLQSQNLVVQNHPDELDKKIQDAEFHIHEIENIILHTKEEYYKYQTRYARKIGTIQRLRNELTSLEGKDVIDEIYNSTTNWEQESSQVFGDSDDELHEEQKSYSNKNTKKSYESVTSDTKSELYNLLGDIPYKKIFRKISFLLHEDHLKKNQFIQKNPHLLQFFTDILKKILTIHNVDDTSDDIKKSLILAIIEDAGISYKDGNFILPDLIVMQKRHQKNEKEKKLEQLVGQIGMLKTNPIYMFYKAKEHGYIEMRERQMDNEIQRLEDLINSFATL